MPYPDSEYPSVLRGHEKRQSQRLLNAAPDLLAALYGVLHWAECECQSLARDTPLNDDPPTCAYCVARAVIAKAEGRPHA
jgi:hypothetical protein